MAYNFNDFKKRTAGVLEWLQREFSTIRTGRAAPALLDSVLVEAYGSRVPLSQVGSVTTEDARTVRVAPWDTAQIRNIEKAIVAANLGISAAVDDRGVRVIFPELTSERRASLVKLSREKLEEARVSLRMERDKTKNEIEKQKKDGALREDDATRAKTEMQKIVDEVNKKLEEAALKKEKEING